MLVCIKFQEEYKRLDLLCKDCYNSQSGISEYIRLMDAEPYSTRRFISSWDDDYNQLKHVRWVRNQLAHEVGTLESDICTEDDVFWISNFYQRILNGNDPLTVLRKEKEAIFTRNKTANRKQSITPAQQPTLPTSAKTSTYTPTVTQKNNDSWLYKILKKITSWFKN